MGEPFKNVFNRALIKSMAQQLYSTDSNFSQQAFIRRACRGLEYLEFKARSQHIADALQEYLPSDYRRLCEVVVRSLHPDDCAPLQHLKMSEEGIRGWAILPLAECVAQRAGRDFELAMNTLAHLSCRFTAEFAVRRLINQDPKRALNIIAKWSESTNFHIRRLASEGSRPRLPWGQQIPVWIEDPSPLLPILATMRSDPSDYVRKSVANHLNDISKDHPQLLLRTLRPWRQGASDATERLIRHACRTLIKQGNLKALQLIGCRPVTLRAARLSIKSARVAMGDAVEFHFQGDREGEGDAQLEVDYVMHFVKKSGATREKVFKWKRFHSLAGGQIQLTKKHSFKPITTRNYYPGTHKISVQINGHTVAESEFELVV